MLYRIFQKICYILFNDFQKNETWMLEKLTWRSKLYRAKSQQAVTRSIQGQIWTADERHPFIVRVIKSEQYRICRLAVRSGLDWKNRHPQLPSSSRWLQSVARGGSHGQNCARRTKTSMRSKQHMGRNRLLNAARVPNSSSGSIARVQCFFLSSTQGRIWDCWERGTKLGESSVFPLMNACLDQKPVSKRSRAKIISEYIPGRWLQRRALNCSRHWFDAG